MSLNHEPNPNAATDAQLDEHIAALTSFAANQEPAPELLSRTLAMLNAPEANAMRIGDDLLDRGSIPIRKKPFMSFSQRLYAAMSLAAAACLIWFFFILLSAGGATVAYAQVVEKIVQAKALAYSATVMKPDGTTAEAVKMLYADGGRFRMETGHTVSIRNGNDTVMLDTDRHTATRIEMLNMPTTLPSQPTSPVDLVAGLKQMATGTPETLADQAIDGVQASGFKSSWGNGGSFIVWANKKTAEPMRVEIHTEFAGKPMAVVMDHFDMAPPINADTFSTATPSGFTTTTQTMDMTNLGPGQVAESVVAVLDAYSKVSDGMFPDDLTDWSKLMKFDAKGRPQVDTIVIGKMSGQTFGMLSGYHYFGKGMKRGDKDAIVFWYTPKDAKLSRAIYGDLRIEDVETAKLPTTMPTK